MWHKIYFYCGTDGPRTFNSVLDPIKHERGVLFSGRSRNEGLETTIVIKKVPKGQARAGHRLESQDKNYDYYLTKRVVHAKGVAGLIEMYFRGE